MLSLAEPLSYNNPPASYLSSTPGSAIFKCLAWYWLAPNTRKGYAAAINSYVSFCAVHNEKPRLAQTIMLEEWAAIRIFGSTLPKQDEPLLLLSWTSRLVLRSLTIIGVQLYITKSSNFTPENGQTVVAALGRLFIQDPRPPTLLSLGSSPRHSLVKQLSIS